MADHPRREDLERFMLGELAEPESRDILRHLLEDCPDCRRTTGLLWQIGSEGAEELPLDGLLGAGSYDGAIRRAGRRVQSLQERRAEERAAAPRLLAELARLPAAHRRLLVRNSSRYHSWGLCEILLERGQEERFGEPRAYEELAELAIAVAEALPAADYGEQLIADLLARGWAELANARRLLADFRSSERAFRTAEQHLAKGGGDPLERARLLDLKASLRYCQARRPEAHALLDRAIGTYRRYGADHAAGRALVKKAVVHHYAGENETAVGVLAQALPLIDVVREPRLVLTAHHNLAVWLQALGRLDEAVELIARSRPLYAAFGDEVDLIRLRLVEGKIAAARGRVEEAEAALREAREGFVAKEMGDDAAQASLDLAELYAAQGRTAEVLTLANEMLRLFGSQELEVEAMAALILFEQAAAAEQATAGLVHEISLRLQQARREPTAPET